MLTPLSPPPSPLPPSPPPPTIRTDNPLAEKDMKTQRVGRNNDKKCGAVQFPTPRRECVDKLKNHKSKDVTGKTRARTN